MMVNLNHTGWWFQPTPLKNHGLKVSWKYDIPNMMGKIIQSCSSHHQPAENVPNGPWRSPGWKMLKKWYQFGILQYRYLNDRQAEA